MCLFREHWVSRWLQTEIKAHLRLVNAPGVAISLKYSSQNFEKIYTESRSCEGDEEANQDENRHETETRPSGKCWIKTFGGRGIHLFHFWIVQILHYPRWSTFSIFRFLTVSSWFVSSSPPGLDTANLSRNFGFTFWGWWHYLICKKLRIESSWNAPPLKISKIFFLSKMFYLMIYVPSNRAFLLAITLLWFY